MVYFCSPLSTLAHVLRTRCSATVAANWPLSVASLTNCALWTVYGLAIGRPFVYGPNAAGRGLSLVQLALIFVFPTTPRAGAGLDDGAGSSSGDEEIAGKGAVAAATPGLVSLDLRVTSTGREAGAPPPRAAGLDRSWSAGQWGGSFKRMLSRGRSSRVDEEEGA